MHWAGATALCYPRRRPGTRFRSPPLAPSCGMTSATLPPLLLLMTAIHAQHPQAVTAPWHAWRCAWHCCPAACPSLLTFVGMHDSPCTHQRCRDGGTAARRHICQAPLHDIQTERSVSDLPCQAHPRCAASSVSIPIHRQTGMCYDGCFCCWSFTATSRCWIPCPIRFANQMHVAAIGFRSTTPLAKHDARRELLNANPFPPIPHALQLPNRVSLPYPLFDCLKCSPRH